MKYTKKEVANKINEIGLKIHELDRLKDIELDEHRAEIHNCIRNSSISYREVYPVVRKAYPVNDEFYSALGRIRETIWSRDHS